MNVRARFLSSALVAAATLMVLTGTLYFASRRPGYSHVSNTISELGETGAPQARLVNFGFFLPAGLLVWLALWVVHRKTPTRPVSYILAALSCLGTGYVLCEFFPCDPGAPLFGSWRTEVHDFLGFLDYAGTGAGFLLVSRHLARRGRPILAAAFSAAGVVVLFCPIGLVLFSVEGTFHVRGAVQRAAEALQFTGVFFACSCLSGETAPESPQRAAG
jgi:hypothetical membrane protein